MHRTTKRLASALLAAVLCAAAALPAGADYEPWTYEVDSVMGGYGVEYYSDVGFENPTSKPSTTTAQQSSGGVSTYSSAQTGRAVALGGAESGTAVDTGLGYTVTQLPGGITLYSPTDDAAAYAMDSGMAVSNDVATYAASGSQTITGEENGTQTFSITIPATLELDKDKSQTMTLTGEVRAYSGLKISVDKEDGTTYELKCSDDANSPTLKYTLERGELLGATTYTKLDYAKIGDGSWDNEINGSASVKYFKTTLTATMAADNSYNIAGSYTDTLTFTLDGRRKSFEVTYKKQGDDTTLKTQTYACGSSDKLPTAADVGLTVEDGYSFVGWTTWNGDSSVTGTKRIYAPGMYFSMITQDDIYNVYTGGSNATSVTLYAYCRSSSKVTNYEATVYVEKATLNFNGINGVSGSGVYKHEEYSNDGKTFNYEQGGADKLLPETVTLQNVGIVPGEVCYWTLDELNSHLPDNNKITGGDKIYLDKDTAAKVVASDETDTDGNPTSVTLYVNRNLICFDLNVLIKQLGTASGVYTSGGSLKFALNDGTSFDLGTAAVDLYVGNQYVNGIVNPAKTDSWQVVTYGATVKITVYPNSRYELMGYQANGNRNFSSDDVWDEQNNTFTVEITPASDSVKSYTFHPIFKEVEETTSSDTDTVTLLPEMDKTKPVVIDMPTIDLDDAADTKADTKKDTAADTTESTAKADTKADDTTTTGSGTKTDTKASDTTADAADEKTTTDTTTKADADTTPDDLMIWDADTMPALVVDDYDANELAVVW